MDSEAVYLLALLACGAGLGYLSRWGPLSDWLALAFPLVLPAAGIFLGFTFC